MRPILCVVDLSEKSTRVLEVAARMAHAYGSHLIVLFPYRLIDRGYNGDVAKLKAKLEQEAKEKFTIIRSQVSGLEQLSYDFQPEIGFPADRIISYVKRNKADSVIVSQRQATQMNELNPSALQTLITNSRLPFTIVPEEVDAEVAL